MIATLFFFLENIQKRHIVLLVQWYTCTNLLSPDGVHPQISSSLRLLVLCLVRPNSFVIYYCLFIFSKEPISFIGSLDKCHTSLFNVLTFSRDSMGIVLLCLWCKHTLKSLASCAVHISEFVLTITFTIENGFQNNLTQLLFITCRCAIWNIRSGRLKVKATLGQIFVGTIALTILDCFEYRFAQLFSIMSRFAIWNICSGRHKVKVTRDRHVVVGQPSRFRYHLNFLHIKDISTYDSVSFRQYRFYGSIIMWCLISFKFFQYRMNKSCFFIG